MKPCKKIILIALAFECDVALNFKEAKEKIPTENDQVSNSLEATLNRADKLFYQAKQKGRNRVVVD